MNDFEEKLNSMRLPEVYMNENKEFYLDPVRNKLIQKTPEETLRQKMLRYLTDVVGVPSNMLQVEVILSEYGIKSKKRADIIIEEEVGEDKVCPLAIVECKAPHIMIGDSAMDQVTYYADKLLSKYIILTNGFDCVTAIYDADEQAYKLLNEIPTYDEMLGGGGVLSEPVPEFKRFSFEELYENRKFYCDYYFNPDTPEKFLTFITNFFQGFLDVSHKMPAKSYKIFKIIKDYGIRSLSNGNSSGYSYQGVNRSLLIEFEGNTQFVNLSFFDYGTSTILTVSTDREKAAPHNSLQYSIDKSLIKDGETYHFIHNGSINIGKYGRARNQDMIDFVKKEFPSIVSGNKIDLGTVKNNSLIYLDTPEVTDFIENLISYALVRDKFRKIKKAEFDAHQ